MSTKHRNARSKRYVYKVNGDTGEIDNHVVIPNLGCAYGGAVDGLGNLWIIDPSLADPSSSIVLWQLNMDSMWATQHTVSCGYGIMVDSQNRVWSGGNVPCVSRFEPLLEVEDVTVIPPEESFPRGIAVGVAKSAGYVWQVETDGLLHKINEETMAMEASYAFPGSNTIGVAVDFEGYVWVVSQCASQVYKFDPDIETYITITEILLVSLQPNESASRGAKKLTMKRFKM